MKKILSVTLLIIGTFQVVGCGKHGGTFYIQKTLEPGATTILTTADLSAITSVQLGPDNYDQSTGRVKPKQIICVQPSADVAKAVADAFATTLAVEAKNAQGLDAKGQLELSKVRSESLAQLGKRLGTIQLLREGLYRACEAYSNGAITSTTYSLILSRVDDLMITMLLAEFASGDSSGPLALILNSANATTHPGSDNSRSAGNSGNENTENTNEEQSDTTQNNDSQKTTKKEKAKEGSAKNSDTNTSGTNARVEQPTGNASGSKNAAISDYATYILYYMQDNYLNNLNFDAVTVACISAMTIDPNGLTQFTKYCKDTLIPWMACNVNNIANQKIGYQVYAACQLSPGQK